VVADSAVDGLHEYVTPPLAASVVDVPLQIATFEPPLIDGVGFTVTVTLALFTHPFASVPVTVKVVVSPGLAETDEPVVADRDEPGAQV